MSLGTDVQVLLAYPGVCQAGRQNKWIALSGLSYPTGMYCQPAATQRATTISRGSAAPAVMVGSPSKRHPMSATWVAISQVFGFVMAECS